MKRQVLHLFVFALLFAIGACSLPTETRQKLNLDDAPSGKFDRETGSYCRSGLGDWLDITSLRLQNIAPQTYCLFDAFGVERKVVLDILQKYKGRTYLADEEAKEIVDKLNVRALIQKISSENRASSKKFLLYASLDNQLAQLPIIAAPLAGPFAPAYMALSALSLAIPAFTTYLEAHPEILEETNAFAKKSSTQIVRLVSDIQSIIKNELCSNIRCTSVTVRTQKQTDTDTSKPIIRENGQQCPPCRLANGAIIPVGTIAYRYDRLPPDKEQHGIKGDHLNLYICNQNPNNCQCFWQRGDTVSPPPQPNWIPIQPFR